MRKHILLKDSIDLLKRIQVELHDDIDSSKRNELDRIIKELESCEEELTPNQLLFILGKVVVFIPAIERIFRKLSEL